MTLFQEGCLLRIFVGEADRHQGRPLYEWIIRRAREEGLAGATALRGVMGYGANSLEIHTFKIERLSEDMPIIVEIVDTRERLERFLQKIEPAILAGLITMEKAEVRLYRSGKAQSLE